MTVKTILAAKGSNVLSIEPTATLEAAVAMLAKHRDRRAGRARPRSPGDRHPVRARYRARARGARRRRARSEPLAQSMTRKVVTCSQSDTVGALMERMTAGKFRHLPVIEQDQLVGIVSIGDVVKHRACTRWSTKRTALRDYIQTA